MKRVLRNLVGVLLLSMAIAATQIPVGLSEAAGESSDFQLDGTTLVKYTGTAYAVSVPDEVEIIGAEAFSGNNFVKTVRLPRKLEAIEVGAFSYCSVLNKISIPDSVERIGSGAFACCSDLTAVEIGSGVKEIGTGIFAGCTSLKNISLDKKNGSYVVDKGALYDDDMTKLYQYCPGRKESVYIMPDSVTDVGKYAFWGCHNLETVSLNSNIKVLAGYSFSNCRSLKNIEIPYSVKSIGAKAFEDCISLTDVSLPVSIQQIHDTSFDGCFNLTLSGAKDSVAGDYAAWFNGRDKSEQAEYEDIFEIVSSTEGDSEDISSDNIGKGDQTNISDEADVDEEKLSTILGSTTIVGNQAVVFIDNSSGKVYDGSDTIYQNKLNFDEEVTINEPQNTENTLDSEDTISSDGKGIHIPKYTVYNGIIADQAYYKNTQMTSYVFPENVTEIGDFAFARSSLTSIVIPEGVKSIGYGAFYHCDNLNQITLPSTIEDIEPKAFEKTGFIENWKKSGSSDFLTVGNGILIAYNGDDSSVNIPEGVCIIAPEVFAERSEITSVVLPDSVTKICEGAFEKCTRLKQVSGGTNVITIEDRAFANCPLETIRIPDKIEELGLLAFDLSTAGRRCEQKTAVFHGNIPKLSYEETAQRLSNDEYRGRVLNDVSYAVIDKTITIEELKDTVLDGTQFGFKGIIISIDSETDMTASVRATTLTAEELAYFDLSETVEIYGRQYTLGDKQELDQLVINNENKIYNNEGAVLILNKVPDLDSKSILASLSDNTDTWHLCIEKSEAALTRMTEAFNDIYNMNLPMNFVAYDISLYEEESNVSITKLGKQSMRITMPLPDELESGTLFILTADANGQLEDVPYWYDESDNEKKVTFEVNHFSDFGFYTSGTTVYAEGVSKDGKVIIGSYSQKDDSPNTGDFIHPKWVLAGGLFFAALAVFFFRKKTYKIF